MLLRPWRYEDRGPFAEINADPRVMEFFPNCLNRTESDWLADLFRAHFEKYGFGPWAVEVPGVCEFAGYIGLCVLTFPARFTPCVELTGRLAPRFWGGAYAFEGARAAFACGFAQFGLDEIVGVTATGNLRSRATMKWLGMRHSPEDDFEHPEIAPGHPLRSHVLYRLTRERWQSGARR